MEQSSSVAGVLVLNCFLRCVGQRVHSYSVCAKTFLFLSFANVSHNQTNSPEVSMGSVIACVFCCPFRGFLPHFCTRQFVLQCFCDRCAWCTWSSPSQVRIGHPIFHSLLPSRCGRHQAADPGADRGCASTTDHGGNRDCWLVMSSATLVQVSGDSTVWTDLGAEC